jgi:hypothetical protein
MLYSLVTEKASLNKLSNYQHRYVCPEFNTSFEFPVFGRLASEDRRGVDCRLVGVKGSDCRLRTAALGLLFYPRMAAMWTLVDETGSG